MKYLILACILIVSVPIIAKSLKDKIYGNVVVTEVTSIYDGDTFRANIDEFPEIIGHRIGIRIKGIDTPEIRGKCSLEKFRAIKAKLFAVKKLRAAKKIELRNMQRGKYFRIVADVFVDNVNLGSELIKNGHAIVYDGGTKSKNWCEE